MNKEDKATARDLSETDVSNVPGGELNAMILRILTGLEKRVEDTSETLNTKIKKFMKYTAG